MSLNKISINDTTTVNTGVVYDISKATGQSYETLSDALSGNNVPLEVREGGMTVRFILTSDNNYVQYRYMLDDTTTAAAFTNTDNWSFCGDDVLVENPEFVEVHTDAEDKVLYGVKADGDFYFGDGVPKQVQEEIDSKAAEIEGDVENKVDKIPGKGLSSNDYTDEEKAVVNTRELRETSEYMQVTSDIEGKILEDITITGRKEIHIPIDIPSVSVESIKNSEWLKVTEDAKGKILNGIKKDGSHYFYNLHSESIDAVNKRIDNLNIDNSDVKKLLNWKNKTLWWCGTSIPAAGFWNVNNSNAYPYMTGQNISALRVYNEAVGSSQAIRRVNAESYEVVSRRMGNSIADALDICDDLWTIDDSNQTVTAGPRTIGITGIPNVTTYGEACNQRYLLLSNGYEIKLISKYLISDPTENEQFLQEKFGDLYNVLTTLHPNAYRYQSDIDLFIIDHGHNDGPHPVSEEYIDSTDMSTFIGAINTYIRLIMAYKPHARIMVLSDYDNSRSNSETIEAQHQIAEHWHLPFLNITKHLPFTINTRVKVRGYWNTSGIWVETGFAYNPDAQTVAEAFSENGNAYMNSYLGSTIQEIASHITPEQDSNGVWWYYLEPRYIWIKDGLHPHTDKSGRCLSLYAKIVSEFINQN